MELNTDNIFQFCGRALVEDLKYYYGIYKQCPHNNEKAFPVQPIFLT